MARDLETTAFLGRQIEMYRKQRGMSQRELSDQVRALVGKGGPKWPQQYISQLEKGKPRRIYPVFLAAVARVLNVTMADLWGGEDPTLDDWERLGRHLSPDAREAYMKAIYETCFPRAACTGRIMDK